MRQRINPDICSDLAFDLHLCQMYMTRYFLGNLSACGCAGQTLCGLIEICDSTSSNGGPLDECPWAPLAPFISPGWLVVPGRCEPRLVPLFMTVNLTSGHST